MPKNKLYLLIAKYGEKCCQSGYFSEVEPESSNLQKEIDELSIKIAEQVTICCKAK